ncbi:MAG: twin-arginine translocation signal domain-containing protein [Chloroflexi bacterium CFX6]|nr:twin-arginine translocation signal domain-containing protein [Chloroflexi bacterium CFX6]
MNRRNFLQQATATAGAVALNASPHHLFAAGTPIPEVAAAVERAESTAWTYLSDFVVERRPETIGAWVDDASRARVAEVFARTGKRDLRTVFDELDGEVSYDVLRVVRAHIEAGKPTED